jgi:hypothetical protein
VDWRRAAGRGRRRECVERVQRRGERRRRWRRRVDGGGRGSAAAAKRVREQKEAVLVVRPAAAVAHRRVLDTHQRRPWPVPVCLAHTHAHTRASIRGHDYARVRCMPNTQVGYDVGRAGRASVKKIFVLWASVRPSRCPLFCARIFRRAPHTHRYGRTCLCVCLCVCVCVYGCLATCGRG